MFDKFSEECGIFGICNNKNAVQISLIGLHALQHRGQEAAGFAAFNSTIKSKKRTGKILESFNVDNIGLVGTSCIAHTRYSTCATNDITNIQPFLDQDHNFAIAHNGHIFTDNSTISDSYYIVKLIENTNHNNVEKAFIETVNKLKGGFAIICLYKNKILAARDSIGIRPLILGKLDNSYIVCSESCALDAINAEFIREIENGEIIICDNNGIKQLQEPNKQPARLCIFEYIYFARQNSHIKNKSIYEIRKNMGKILAQECLTKADIVVPIQNSGTSAALGYAQQSKTTFELALNLNNYVGRSFIQPNNNLRTNIAAIKHSIIKEFVKNKDIILVDDSLVRGTTIKQVITQLRKAQVKKIHLRIASPVFKYPDRYGIDIRTQEELLYSKYPTIEAMQKYLELDSLYFLSLDGLYEAIEGTKRNKHYPQYTDHYFTGEYPLP